MRRISSRTTSFTKRVLPPIVFIVVAFYAASLLYGGLVLHKNTPYLFWVLPAALAVFCYLVMKFLILDVVDEVFDAGDALIIRNAGREERVALSAIEGVGYARFVNPARVTLRLQGPSIFGTKVVFNPRGAFPLLSAGRMVDELSRRIEAARSAP
jgi:hypothetical protein